MSESCLLPPFPTPSLLGTAAAPDVVLVRGRSKKGRTNGQLGVEDMGSVGAAGWRKMKVKDNKGFQKKMEELEADGFEAEPDYILNASLVPNDSSWSSIATAMNRIGAPAAWDMHTGNNAGST